MLPPCSWNWKALAPVPVVEAHRLGRLQRGRCRHCPSGPGTCPLSRGPWRSWGLQLALGARRLSFPSRRGRTWQPGAGSLLCGGPPRSPVCGDRSPIHRGHWAGASGEGTQASQKRSERARVQEKNQSLFLLRWEQGTLGGVGGQACGGVRWGEPSWGRAGLGPGGSQHCSSGIRTVTCRPPGVPSCRGRRCHPSQPFIPSAGRGGLRTVAMQSALLPFLALWAGCCPGGALTRQGPGLREPVLQPASIGLPTLRPLLPSPSGPPDGE